MPKLIWDVDPVLTTISGVQIRYYALCYVLTLFSGYLLLGWQLRRAGADREETGDFLGYGFIGLVAGARVGHVLGYDFERFAHEPEMLFEIWRGGLASHGAALGLILAMYWFTKRRAIPLLDGTDRLAFAVPAGAFLFRLGNLFNSEIVGKPSDGTWGIRFPRFDAVLDGPYRHPTQLYEMLLALLVFALLIAADRHYGRELRPRGMITALLLIALFSGRILIEFFNEPQPGEPLGFLNRGQLLSIPFVLAGAALLVMSLQKRQPAGWIVDEAYAEASVARRRPT